MGITHGGVHNQKLLLLIDPLGYCIWALFVQHLLEARSRRCILQWHEPWCVVHFGTSGGVVYNDVSDVFKNFVGSVL